MRGVLLDIPKHVLISAATIAGSLILFSILMFTLGAARDDSIALDSSLTGQITDTRRALTQLEDDRQFVLDNQAAYENLMESDRLVPHTRRVAISELNRLAVESGLTSLNYSFQAAGDASPELAGSQPASGAFKVSLEQVELNVGAPFDGPVYRFVDALSKTFPGSAVVQSIDLSRAPQVTDTALRDVSEGRPSRLVEGTILMSWRTAQSAVEENSEGSSR